MIRIEKVLYTGRVHTSGGRDGKASSDDGRLDVSLSTPGSRGLGTNPEQLLAAGWSACFIGALGKAAAKHGVKLPADVSVDAEIDLGMTADAYLLQARLRVNLPGLAPDVAQTLVETAHGTCPYSKALHGNIHIETEIA
ncbi:organic hydroperoxide resistance protein [Cupriavidus agavae]|uniref:Ohr subfamily peroxiredoxin n=1 Tax=Cupriavidus agavae TaxID=1001822 RepID=A0A4Q7R8B4_9BURK|nr:organic hydroperoxide resistance protein [Cupriavidus agavae]RZT29034.1 Ohr subfamily peroxiredoxin [Cupriavidus agavae]